MFLVLGKRLGFNIFAFVLSCLWIEQWGTVRSVCKVPMTILRLFLWAGGVDCGMWAVTCTVGNRLSNFLLASPFWHSSSRSPPHTLACGWRGGLACGVSGHWLCMPSSSSISWPPFPKSHQWPLLPMFVSLGFNVLGLALGKADRPVSFWRAL